MTPIDTYGLTEEEIQELRELRDGADIYGRPIAERCRSIQRKAPQLIIICEPMGSPPAHHRQPYFGAVTSIEGKRFLDKLARQAKKEAKGIRHEQ